MAQIWLTEYDAKRLFAQHAKTYYPGIRITSLEDFPESSENKWVIKVDQLIGKRGKLGLIGVNLSLEEAKQWFCDHCKKTTHIGNTAGILTHFLLEPFTAHAEEYYVSIRSHREYDEILFSTQWWINIEDNWDIVQSMKIPLSTTITQTDIQTHFSLEYLTIAQTIFSLFTFYQKHFLTYLEVNPFCITGNTVTLLDMVAKIDDATFFLQKDVFDTLYFLEPFGTSNTPDEQYIQELDQKTGASLKLKILNPNGAIWTLLSGWWASLVISDTIGDLWFFDELANYGELSGNPDREFTREYTKILLKNMLQSPNARYLVIAWAIANFTHIDKTFSGIIDALDMYQEQIREKNIHILCRRWGINDKKWLTLLQNACQEMNILCDIADWEVYMTDILQKITL